MLSVDVVVACAHHLCVTCGCVFGACLIEIVRTFSQILLLPYSLSLSLSLSPSISLPADQLANCFALNHHSTLPLPIIALSPALWRSAVVSAKNQNSTLSNGVLWCNRFGWFMHKSRCKISSPLWFRWNGRRLFRLVVAGMVVRINLLGRYPTESLWRPLIFA